MTQNQTASTSTATRWLIDPAHSLVEFAAKHMMITTVKGRVAIVGGTIFGEEGHPDRARVEVELDPASVDTGSAERDQHLRSADFLNADRHPDMMFRSTSLERKREGPPEPGEEFTLSGELTIRSVTRPVKLDVTYEGRGQDPWGGERVSFSAKTKIDRREWDLTWNQALETGGVLVSNDLKVSIEIQATRETPQRQ
jgi:polyisoprenoid-binding protein YceI